ncbi:hypothetical protein PACTADRAFT_49761 [Pachysolen tannophilus NRRL Y-2460]|uniref:LicD/FKTN/FKRP nucleotidyltransferase domain-containing protein n=1 Tax=Pachysolen tannophilus NRRL Y-2460 TaxID=669874 RepID=A0A1E4TXF3_PACTA|nr:hypothetical protein PACTADRAFT_49761 [Pachysolen tannophilus NRRL Y-2460]
MLRHKNVKDDEEFDGRLYVKQSSGFKSNFSDIISFFKRERTIKIIVPILYIISFIILFKDVGLKDELDSENSLTSYIYNFHDSFSSSSGSSTSQFNLPATTPEDDGSKNFEYFKYKADAVMLPIAPYKHIQESNDLRSTQLVYLHAIKQYLKKVKESGKNNPPQFDFHWKDWIDMSELNPLISEKPNCFIAGVLGSNIRTEWDGCIDIDSKDPNELHFYFQNPAVEPESEFRLALRAKSYLYSAAPIPERIVFLAGELAFVVKSANKRELAKNGMLVSFIKNKLDESNEQKEKIFRIEEDDVIKQPISASNLLHEIEIEIGRNLTTLDSPGFQYIEVDLSNFEFPPNKKKTKKALQARIANEKHFHNALVKQDDNSFESNYDWRFFEKTLDHQRHRAALHHTIRSWLQMSSNLGIITWLSRETLIGWGRNGLILPWETVIHFELPAKELIKLAMSFNNSLVVADASENSNTYLLDVSPHFMERTRENDGGASPEAPDARFIDTKTGVYIELNGLAVTDAELPDSIKKQHPSESKNRKNFANSGMGKFYRLKDILPLKKTLFEGRSANVPYNAMEITLTDYPDVVTTDDFFNYHYHDHLRLWIPAGKCNYVPQEDITLFENGQSSYIGACHDNNIWREYNMTEHATRFRKIEIESEEPLTISPKDDLPPLYPDYWLEDRIEYLNENYGYPKA